MVEDTATGNSQASSAQGDADGVSSKMSKTYITPPERFRRKTIRDDLRVKYQGPDIEKKGSKGRPITLDGNMFKITVDPNISIFMYSVNFEPDVKLPMYRIKLMNQCQLGDRYFYNGNVLFLPYQTDEPFVHSVKKNNGESVSVTFKFKSALQAESLELNNMLGSFVKRCIADMDLVQINNGLYLMNSKQCIDNYDLDVVSGYKTTVLPHEDSLMLTVNLSNRVMARSSVLDNMNNQMRKLGPSSKDVMLRDLVGKTVITRYNNKTYKIDDIDFDRSPESTFPQRQRDGTNRDVSFLQYFRDTYNVNINDPKQPMLISRKKKFMQRGKPGAARGKSSEGSNMAESTEEIMLVPELCFLTGIPDEYLTDFRFKKAMQSKIKSDPHSRRRALDDFVSSFKRTNAHKVFQRWGFSLNPEPASIPARIIDPYKFEFGKGEKAMTDKIIDFRNKQLYDAHQPIKRWALIHPSGCNREADEFVNCLMKVARGLGMSVGNPKLFEYRSERDPRGLSSILNNIKSFEGKADMLVLMQKTPNKDLYDFFKKETCLQMGVPSQVLLLKHFRNPKGLMSIITKIAIQMQCKVGGAPWAINFPPKDIFMIVGMDTYHDSSKKGLSCCAAVASLNNTFTKYTWSTAMVQGSQEINTHMRSLFQNLLQTFIETHNGLKPTKIIIFRDGVGEGQVSHINEYEFTSMQQCISEVSPSAKLACLTLSKRIETRFFERGQNPKSGTVVDQVCTHAGQKDFYLVPLESRQGTVAPIHYRLHFNTFSLAADNFQYLAYLLCHMYFNWAGAIKVPAVCQYAHKIAYLIGTSLHSKPHPDLKTKLFFL